MDFESYFYRDFLRIYHSLGIQDPVPAGVYGESLYLKHGYRGTKSRKKEEKEEMIMFVYVIKTFIRAFVYRTVDLLFRK